MRYKGSGSKATVNCPVLYTYFQSCRRWLNTLNADLYEDIIYQQVILEETGRALPTSVPLQQVRALIAVQGTIRVILTEWNPAPWEDTALSQAGVAALTQKVKAAEEDFRAAAVEGIIDNPMMREVFVGVLSGKETSASRADPVPYTYPDTGSFARNYITSLEKLQDSLKYLYRSFSTAYAPTSAAQRTVTGLLCRSVEELPRHQGMQKILSEMIGVQVKWRPKSEYLGSPSG